MEVQAQKSCPDITVSWAAHHGMSVVDAGETGLQSLEPEAGL